MTPNEQQAQRKPSILQMPGRRSEDDVFMPAFITMLAFCRRCYELGGDPGVKEIIDKAERALARR